MKALFIITCLLLSTIIYSQESYKRCLDGERTKWSIIYEVLDDFEHSLELTAYSDTLINEVSYKRMYRTEYYEFEDSNTQWQERIDQGYQWEQYHIRESADASQLYVYDSYREKEYLVSDMNLEVGDPFPVPEIWENEWIFWDIDTLVVDSIYVQNGLKHIRLDCTWKTDFYLDNHYSDDYYYYINYDYHVTFIEGIGPNTGVILIPLYLIEQVVNCFQNESTYWKNEYVSYPCGYFYSHVGMDPVFPKPKYFVYPTGEGLEIVSSINSPVQLTLYNTMGTVCYTGGFSGNQPMLIPSSSMPHGMYLLKIEEANQKNFQVVKIIL